MERTRGPQIVQFLNEMLEEERAAVEAVIGLTSMATDPNERENLQRIGGDEVQSCIGLRERIESLGGAPSRHISDFANYVLSLEYFPERLRTFGRHQRLIMERISALLTQRGLDNDTRGFLEAMLAQHAKDITWCEQRAAIFEASRHTGEAARANAGHATPTPAPLPSPATVTTQPAPMQATSVPAAESTPPAANGNGATPERPKRVVRRKATPESPEAGSAGQP
jgi:hypothetical protein